MTANIGYSQSERLDHRVVSLQPQISRAYAARLIDDGKVTVNGEVITKAGHKLKSNDVVIVDYDHHAENLIPDIELSVLYEDDDCVVIEKPVGVLTHSKGAFNPEATVATWLRNRIIGMDGDRGGIVHRLDRATSGLMICAKKPEALSWLQKQFSQRRVKKTYIAIIKGELSPVDALIDMPIERNPKKPQTFRVGVNGKSATTSYHTIEYSNGYSLLELIPETGRTHQLRVHLAYQHKPIVGDTLYGGEIADRLYLHAHKLELTLPNKERRVFISKIPGNFKNKLSA